MNREWGTSLFVMLIDTVMLLLLHYWSNYVNYYLGPRTSFWYYLKAWFHFDKKQFADLMAISNIAGTVSQAAFNWTILSCVHMFIYSIAWSSWVPYAAAMFSILFVSHNPVYIEGLIESVVVPLELLQQLKLSDFTDQQEYEEWQKRTLKVLKMTNLRKKRSSSSRKSKEYRSKLFIQPH